MRIIRYQNRPTYSPAGDFTSLRDEMDRLFALALPALPHDTDFPVDLYRDKESFVVRAELPGFRKEDLNIEVADGVLTVTAHRQTGEGKDKATEEARLSRAISLPEQVKVEAIAAKYEDGVLTVTLPKRDEVKPRQITVEVK